MEKMLRRLLGEDVDFHLHLNAKENRIEVDLSQLQQVLMNLCVNARDAMPGGGTLTIETQSVFLDERYTAMYPEMKTGAYVLLAVGDTGTGMDEATRSQIFDPFFTTKEKGKGTGLGLATVYGIVKQHGGEITVASEPGSGTLFKILLPQAKENLAGEGENLEEDAACGHGETILVVEDEVSVRKMVCTILTRLGYTVIEAETAEKCLEYAREPGRIDLLLTDVIMPGMNGRQLQERIAMLRPGIKTLFMSGYTEDMIGQHGILKGGTHFIFKPFTEKALNHAIRECLDAASR
jgi:two-component system, cell cycle sensor histidine kinase and response regulator CckA